MYNFFFLHVNSLSGQEKKPPTVKSSMILNLPSTHIYKRLFRSETLFDYWCPDSAALERVSERYRERFVRDHPLHFVSSLLCISSLDSLPSLILLHYIHALKTLSVSLFNLRLYPPPTALLSSPQFCTCHIYIACQQFFPIKILEAAEVNYHLATRDHKFFDLHTGSDHLLIDELAAKRFWVF